MGPSVEIIPNQTFKHGGETYEKSERYTVSVADGTYFAQAGWVGAKGESGPKEQTLDVQDIKLGHSSEVK